MKKTILLFLCLSLAQLLAGPNAALAEIFRISPAQDIVLDGKLDDWPKEAFRVGVWHSESDIYHQPLADFNLAASVLWDEAGLYLLIEGEDDEPNEGLNVNRLWNGDAVEIIISAEPESKTCYQIIATPGYGDPDGKPRYKAYDFRNEDAKTVDIEVDVHSKIMGSKYVMELFLPWTNLGSKPEMGERIGFQIYANDKDDDNRTTLATFYPQKDKDNKTAMHFLELAEQPSPQQLLLWKPEWLMERQLIVEYFGHPSAVGKRLKLEDDQSLIHFSDEVAEPSNGSWVRYRRLVTIDGERLNPRLLLGDEPVLSAYAGEIRWRDSSQRLAFDVKETRNAKIRVTPNPSDLKLPEIEEVELAIADLSGDIVFSKEIDMREEIDVDLEPGAFKVSARATSPDGQLLRGQSVIVIEEDQGKRISLLEDALDAWISENDAEFYRGWTRYHLFRYRAAIAKGEDFDIQKQLGIITHLLRASGSDPYRIKEKRGTFEWAYPSDVDDSGQPFRIEIPDNYDPSKSHMLAVHLHGKSGTHMARKPLSSDAIGLSVMGRARGNGYNGLAEVDVLDAIAFVKKHWNVDEDRVHLSGTSMGGGGTFILGSRHPDLFASVRPLCGYAFSTKLENLLNVPLVTVHSIDDDKVPIIASRYGTARLNKLGGIAFSSEPNGVGHQVSNARQEIKASQLWAQSHQRIRKPRRVSYIAHDQIGRKAYWASVEEWGGSHLPASFNLKLTARNDLHMQVENCRVLKLDLTSAPVDPSLPLNIYSSSLFQFTVPAPLPDSYHLTFSENPVKGSAVEPEPPAARLHFPGGAQAMYHGEPFLIVYGTQGNPKMTAQQKKIANIIAASPNPNWAKADLFNNWGPMMPMLFGRIPVKADSEVTDEDIESYNLYLLGTPDENLLVARLSDKLPVRLDGDQVVCKDGVAWSFRQRAFSLLHYNPLAPQRLMFWVASHNKEFYEPNAPLLQMQQYDYATPDFFLAENRTVVARRCFDARWQWEDGYADSPILRNRESVTANGYAKREAEAIMRASDADCALVSERSKPTELVYAPEESRLEDALRGYYDYRVVLFELSGAQLQHAQKKMAAHTYPPDENERILLFYADPLKTPDPEAVYTVACYPWSIWDFVSITRIQPETMYPSEHAMRDAVQRHWTE